MNRLKSLFIFFIATCCLSSCAVRKNNWATRNYHAMVTRFNIYFNGNEAYKEGIKKIQKAENEDYSKLIPVYAVSIPGATSSVARNMEISIEKCRKAIKLHSIQKKPKTNYKKLKDIKYQSFLKKEEYNYELKNAWLLLGKAEFHKGDFIGAVGTFSYILRHYSTEPDMVLMSKLWMARCYSEMKWLYESEDILTKINPTDLTYKSQSFFAGAMADVLIKQNRDKEAIAYLQTATEHERDRIQQRRFNYILAQLYVKTGCNEEADKYFNEVIKSSPPYAMEFNAQIQRASIAEGNNKAKMMKLLEKMAKSGKNKNYLDQIYSAIGDIYLSEKNETKAIESYKQAIEKSTRNGIEKAMVQIKLADLYYDKRNYIEAQPYYSDAAQILNAEHGEYRRVSSRAAILTELTMNYRQVVLQDSLQKLAKMPQEQKVSIIEKIIDDLIEQEAEQEARMLKEAREVQSSGFQANLSQQSTDWYFYNNNLINKGKTEFQKKWGIRKLEDNWRRQNKTESVNMAEEDLYAETENQIAETQIVTDNKTVEYYLQQLPTTEDKVRVSNQIIAKSLFDMGYIYYLQLEDFPLAIETFKDYQRRFPEDDKNIESQFLCYQIAKKEGNTIDETVYRNRILEKAPDSKYAKLLSQPDYAGNLSAMYAVADSLYEKTYVAYTEGRLDEIVVNYEFMKKNYPLSNLMPKFAFLNALRVAKTMSSEQFKTELETMIKQYPQSDVTAMAKDILSLMNQGKEATHGTTHGTLLTKREEHIQQEQPQQKDKKFVTDLQLPFLLVLELTVNENEANKFLFDVAAFNFTKFMIKDFDLKLRKENGKFLLLVSNFENYKESVWYLDLILKESNLKNMILSEKCRTIFISEENLELIPVPFSWEDYEIFYKQNILTLSK